MSTNSRKTKLIGIAYLLVSLILTIVGLAKENVVDEFNIYWMMTFSGYVLGALMFVSKGANLALYLSRILVGSLFIVSGLIKANDTLGFGYKLEEYFEPSALGYMADFWTYFYDYSFAISVFVSGVEVILGLMLLFGVKSRWAVVMMLGLTVFFAWLTYYTASCNDAQTLAMQAGEEFKQTCVNDCGCFGDALRGSIGRSLTPWESFYKDLALMFYVVLMVLFLGKLEPNKPRHDAIILPLSIMGIIAFAGGLFGWMFPTYFTIVLAVVYYIIKKIIPQSPKHDAIQILAYIVLTYSFITYTVMYLPIKDYRPYAVGKNLVEQMKSAEELGLESPVYAIKYTFKNKKTGEDTIILSSDYLNIYSNEEFKNTYEAVKYDGPTIKIKDGYEAPITEEEVEFENLEIFEQVKYSEQPLILVVMYNLDKANKRAIKKLNDIKAFADANGYLMYGVTATPDAIDSFKAEYGATYEITTADEKILKAVVRSNPGVVLLQNGNILGKWSARDVPSQEEIQEKLK